MKNINFTTSSIITAFVLLLIYFFFFYNVNFYKIKLDSNFFFEKKILLFNSENIQGKQINFAHTNIDKEIINPKTIKLFGKISDKGEFVVFLNKKYSDKLDKVKFKFFLDFFSIHKSTKNNELIDRNYNFEKLYNLSQELIKIEKINVNFFAIIYNYIYSIFYIYLTVFLIINIPIKYK
jgi:hypothetical protein